MNQRGVNMFQPFLYRLGRKLYMVGRGEISNDMTSNGELFVQRSVLAAMKASSSAPVVVFDVGANIGDWTLQLLQQANRNGVQDRMDVHAFEPVPSTASTLRARVPAATVRVHEAAVSSSSGAGEIRVVRDNAGTNSLYDEPGSRALTVKIALITATEFCSANHIPHIHLLKCDTEGHDMEVIRGAMPLLRGGRISVLQFEYNHRWVFARNFLRDVFTSLAGLPYRIAKLQPEGLLLLREWHPELERFFEGNYALVHEDALSWFAAHEATFNASNVLVTGDSTHVAT
jgi:FkbM family methyltransferase